MAATPGTCAWAQLCHRLSVMAKRARRRTVYLAPARRGADVDAAPNHTKIEAVNNLPSLRYSAFPLSANWRFYGS